MLDPQILFILELVDGPFYQPLPISPTPQFLATSHFSTLCFCEFDFFKIVFVCFCLFFAVLQGMWDLSSPARTEPVPPAVEAQSLFLI